MTKNTNDKWEVLQLEQYEVIFLYDDKITVLDRQMVNEGEKVTYKGETPTKEPTNMMTYTFTGWVGEEKMESVTERLILIAKYSAETTNIHKDYYMFRCELHR